jgi:TolB-like protein
LAAILARASAVLGDLQRRHVFRVAVFYLAGAWGLVQVVETVIPLFLPTAADTLARAFVVVAVAGFPLALFLGWRFDLTHEGIRPTPSLRARASDASVAVLPFKDLSSGRDLGHIADALTEELLHALAAIEGLRVASRTSAFAYRDRDEDIREIAGALGVAHVLEGSVRRSGERIRVTAQLIRASDGCHLFSRTFEGLAAHVPHLEDRARSLAQQIQRAMVSGSQRVLQDDSAQMLARADATLSSRRVQDIESARATYQRLLEQNPSAAEAHAGLAESLALLGDLGALAREPAFRSAQESARRALELNPELGRGHAALGFARVLAWEWDGAERNFVRALELEPDRASTHHRFSLFLTAAGRPAEAHAEAERALRLEPDSSIYSSAVAGLLYYNRRYVEALDACAAILDERPDDLYARLVLALTHEQLGDYRSARDATKQAMVAAGAATALLTIVLAHIEASAARSFEARALRDQCAATAGVDFGRAGLHAVLNDVDAAFESLRRALDERDGWLLSLQVHPWIDPLRGDARYTDLVTAMRMPRAPAATPLELTTA